MFHNCECAQALALLPHIVAQAATETTSKTTSKTTSTAQPLRQGPDKSLRHREPTPEDRKLPPGGPPPVSGGPHPVANGPQLSASLATEVEAVEKHACQMDGSSSVFLSRWVARVSPAPSARSGSASPNGFESEPSPPPATSDDVELVDDWGFDWGPASHDPGAAACCSGAEELDVLALLRAPPCSRGGWSGHSSGAFCPELELPA